MFTPPVEVEAVVASFAALFTRPSWQRAQALLCGGLLAPANCVITAALRVLGLSGDAHFQNYHRVLNRARWSAHQAAGILLRLLVQAFVPAGPVVIGLDDTVERRRGAKIAGVVAPCTGMPCVRAGAVFRRPVACAGSVCT